MVDAMPEVTASAELFGAVEACTDCCGTLGAGCDGWVSACAGRRRDPAMP